MKSSKKFLVAALLISAASNSSAQVSDGIRKIKVIDDAAIHQVTTKVYNLKHASAASLTPFIKGAVKSMQTNSAVDRINFKANNGSQHLVVSMETSYLKEIDNLVKALDYPGLIGTGISHFEYNFKNRGAHALFNRPEGASDYSQPVMSLFKKDDSTYHRFNMRTVVWKDSKSDGEKTLKWFKILDVPAPQAEIEFKIYEVSTDNLTDVGVDYATWKTNMGSMVFGKEWIYTTLGDRGDYTNNLNGGEGSFGAFRIDGSYMRMLQSRGKAKVVHSAKIIIKNPTPDVVMTDGGSMQLFKDTSIDATLSLGTDLSITVDRGETSIMPYGSEVNLSYEIDYSPSDDDSNTGQNSFYAKCTRVKMGYNQENIIAGLTRSHSVKQMIGVPFLCELPVVKYLFGTETSSESETKIFVTAQLKNVTIDDNMDNDDKKVIDVVTTALNK